MMVDCMSQVRIISESALPVQRGDSFCYPSLGRAGKPTTPDNTVTAMEDQLGISPVQHL
jgi:hypothetical protein